MTAESLVRWSDDGDVFAVELNRPAKRNALDLDMVQALHEALDRRPKEPRCLVIRSSTPGIFAAGVDLADLLARDSSAALERINVELFDRIADHRWPSIAIVDGPALGAGCELALACDLRIASTRAVFGLPETALGVIPGAGGLWRLPSRVSRSTATLMLYTGLRIDAADALARGLADSVAEDAATSGMEMASAIARRSWRALELAKLSLRQQERETRGFDVVAQALLFDSEDKRERVSATLKRLSERREKEGAS